MRRTLGILAVAAPFVAGIIAAVSTRHDLRMGFMAIVATLAVWIALRARNPSVAAAFIAFGLASIAAVAVAVLAGARSPFGIIAVAVVISAFATIGRMLLEAR